MSKVYTVGSQILAGFITLTFVAGAAHADVLSCPELFEPRPETSAPSELLSTSIVDSIKENERAQSALADRLEARIAKLRELDGEPRKLLGRLRSRGSALDLKIFETVLDVIEAARSELIYRHVNLFNDNRATTNPATRGFDRPSTAIFTDKDWSFGFLNSFHDQLHYERFHMISISQVLT